MGHPPWFPVENLKRLALRLFLAFEILVVVVSVFWLRSRGLLLW